MKKRRLTNELLAFLGGFDGVVMGHGYCQHMGDGTCDLEDRLASVLGVEVKDDAYDELSEAAASKDVEIARLRSVMFMVANCDPERDRPHMDPEDEDFPCQFCMFWAGEGCDVDGWEPDAR